MSVFRLFCLVIQISLIESYLISTSKYDNFRRPLFSSNEDFTDPYDDIFNLRSPINLEENEALQSVWTIDSSKEITNSTPPKKLFGLRSTKIDENGLLSNGDEKVPDWLLEAQDVIEMQRGYAIWSKRSDVEIQREKQKLALSKGMNIPDSVGKVIRLVYLERAHKLQELRKDRMYELACLEYRKWVNEQRKKLKKDPIPMAKVELSKRWVVEAPHELGDQTTPGLMPAIVLDERRDPVYGVVMESNEKGTGSVVTFSMKNWDKSPEELQSLTKGNLDSEESTKIVRLGRKEESPSFKIDDNDVFTVCDGEYYVVL